MMLPSLRLLLLGFICTMIRLPDTAESEIKDGDIVSNLNLTPEAGMIHVSWQLQNPSGGVHRYDVRWRDEAGDSRLCYVTPPEHHSVLITTEECPILPLPLKPCTEYQVIVLPKKRDDTLIGLFESKSTKTLNKAPSEPEQLVCVLQTDNQALMVTWSAPNTPCDITGYKVSWTFTSLWSHDTAHGSIDHISPVLSYTITRITPYTKYIVSVAGVVAGELEGSASNCTTNTPEAPPSAPQNLEVLQATSNSLSFRWQSPGQPNGIITGYTVECTINGDDSLPNNIVELPNSENTHVINELLEDESYFISVKASTRAGEGEAAVGVFHTKAADSASSIYIATISAITLLLVAAAVGIIVLLYKLNGEKNRSTGRSRP